MQRATGKQGTWQRAAGKWQMATDKRQIANGKQHRVDEEKEGGGEEEGGGAQDVKVIQQMTTRMSSTKGRAEVRKVNLCQLNIIYE